jgi:hypothetical protein
VKVSWDDGIPNIWNKYNNHIPNHQPENGDSLFFHPFEGEDVDFIIFNTQQLVLYHENSRRSI